MEAVITSEKVPIKLWLNDIEGGALKQARNLANLPFVFKHIAIMPDCHQGYGMPIGGVMATEGVVIPNAVGVDIGCGMCAVRTSLEDISTDALKVIMSAIRKAIPLGFNKHKEPQPHYYMPDYSGLNLPTIANNYPNARRSLGTLGGGNHFIEIQKGNDGHIWIMIHSGSRNLGKQVADHHNKVAIELNQRYFSEVTKEKQLAFLPLDSEEGKLYLTEMRYCVDYALANRKAMMDKIIDVFTWNCQPETFDDPINIAHNYAVMEHHYNKNVMVHRKGATLARKGTVGIIPGSQGTQSYIVEGKGEPLSFNSCSHGAGRRMGRKQAQRELDLVGEIKRLDDLGVIHSVRTENDLDEAAGAYKDIAIVMHNQADLVDIKVKLTPLAVIKA